MMCIQQFYTWEDQVAEYIEDQIKKGNADENTLWSLSTKKGGRKKNKNIISVNMVKPKLKEE